MYYVLLDYSLGQRKLLHLVRTASHRLRTSSIVDRVRLSLPLALGYAAYLNSHLSRWNHFSSVIIIDEDELSSCSSYTTVNYENYVMTKDAGVQQPSRMLYIQVQQASTSTTDNAAGVIWYAVALVVWLFSVQEDGVRNYSLIISWLKQLLSLLTLLYSRGLIDTALVFYGVMYIEIWKIMCTTFRGHLYSSRDEGVSISMRSTLTDSVQGLSTHQHDPVDAAAISNLCGRLAAATFEAERLYAETSSRSAACMKVFLVKSHSIGNATIDRIDRSLLAYGPSHCRGKFELHVKSIRHNAHVEAEFNAENHQKYFLGHMIVHRMHLNKTALFLRRADEALRTCGRSCNEAGVRLNLIRWHRSASSELHRATDDIQHSRLAYRDLLLHAGRRLGRVARKAQRFVDRAVRELYTCSGMSPPL